MNTTRGLIERLCCFYINSRHDNKIPSDLTALSLRDVLNLGNIDLRCLLQNSISPIKTYWGLLTLNTA